MNRGFYKLFPNLYVAIVGPTGDGKTTCTDIGMSILTELKSVKIVREKLTSYFLGTLFEKYSKSYGESVCSIYSPEMKVTMGDLNKTELVGTLTSWYTCPDKTEINLKGKQNISGGETATLLNLCINFLGCSTPEWLTLGTTTDEIAGGFTGRFVYVFEDVSERDIPFPEDHYDSATEKLKSNLIEDLQHIASLKGKFTITNEAKQNYIIWYKTRRREWTDERLKGYHSRKGDLIFKIAMLLSVARDDNLIIDEKVLQMAFDLLNRIEKKMASAFSGIVDDPSLRYRDRVLSQITRSANGELTRTQILQMNWSQFDGVALQRIMQGLIEAGKVITDSKQIGTKKVTVYKVGE